MPKDRILIIDDEQVIRWSLAEALRESGYIPVEAETGAAGLDAFDAEQPAAVLLDIGLPDTSGLDLLREIKSRQPDAVVIMITANVLTENTIEALRGGAYDFIGKPINMAELQVAIRNGIEAQRFRKQARYLRREREREFGFDRMVGESRGMRNMVNLARKVAASEASSILLQGESGTGKDLVARALHYESGRADAPFVTINCAAIPENLIESELFGYEKGAFTDAKKRKEGLIEQAGEGSIFLDEIGELDFNLQAKLLHVMEGGTFRRVGGLKDIPLNVRVIAASNRDLKAASSSEKFRLDLYYRLAVIQIDIPPLRERGDDILLIANHYIAYFNEKMGRRVRGLSSEAAELFLRYRWPGNVRELRNVIERAMILEERDEITTNYIPRHIALCGKEVSAEDAARKSEDLYQKVFRLPPDGINLHQVEMSLMRQALEISDGNQSHAAKLLGISRDRLRYRMKKQKMGARKQSSAGKESSR